MTTALRAAPIDIDGMCDALQRAFFDDPVMAFLFPDEHSRRWREAKMFEILLRSHHMPHGTVWTTEDHVGAALWSPPGHATIPVSELMRNAIPMTRAFGRRVIRAMRALTAMEKQHPKEPHWYLAVLGTEPAHQGKGIGSALMQPVLDRCDQEGLPAYLESSKESNIPFYSRHGFEVTGEIALPSGGPSVWPMWRSPR